MKKGRKEAAVSDFRAVAHLKEQLGPDRWQALIDSANTGKVQEFCNTLVVSGLPATMTLGGVAYDILSFLKGGEKSVKGDVMVSRAKEMKAHTGKGEREHLLAHQDEIPVMLRGRVVFVFTGERHPVSPGSVFCVYWCFDRWVTSWDGLDDDWHDRFRVLRRK